MPEETSGDSWREHEEHIQDISIMYQDMQMPITEIY